MSEKITPVISKNRKISIVIALSFLWITFIFGLITGFLLLDVYGEEALAYLLYFLIAVGITFVLYGIITRTVLHAKSIRKIGILMATIWILAILGGSIWGTSIAAPQIMARNFSTEPYLTWTDDQDPTNSMTVSWITSYNEPSEVRYGNTSDSLNFVAQNSTKTRFHHISITGLAPNTSYYYQVKNFPIHQFHTAPIGTFNYSFVVWADHRTNTRIESSKNQPNIVKEILARQTIDGKTSAFSIFCGDLTSRANDNTSWDAWFDDIAYGGWAQNQPVQNAYGNHERYGDPTFATVKNYYPYLPKADERFYYSFDYGNAHFIILDPYDSGHSWSANFTVEQLAWLEADLAAHTDANFTMVFMHPPPWALSGVKKDMTRLSAQYGIDLVVCGHQHIFDLRNLNVTKVITIGLGGNPNNDYEDFECETAYVNVDVSPTVMDVTAKFTNGTVLTQLTFNAK